MVEHGLPDLRDPLFDRRRGAREIRADLDRFAEPAFDERPPIQLPAAGARQVPGREEPRRDELVRQRLTEVGAERVDADRRGQHETRVQLVLAVPAADDDRRSLRHRWMPQQLVLDLAQLDAEAADLDLIVEAAEALERPVGQPPRRIRGPVQTRTSEQRARHELRGGQRFVADISAHRPRRRQCTAPLARRPRQVPHSVEHEHANIGEGLSDRHGRGGRGRGAMIEQAVASTQHPSGRPRC